MRFECRSSTIYPIGRFSPTYLAFQLAPGRIETSVLCVTVVADYVSCTAHSGSVEASTMELLLESVIYKVDLYEFVQSRQDNTFCCCRQSACWYFQTPTLTCTLQQPWHLHPSSWLPQYHPSAGMMHVTSWLLHLMATCCCGVHLHTIHQQYRIGQSISLYTHKRIAFCPLWISCIR